MQHILQLPVANKKAEIGYVNIPHVYILFEKQNFRSLDEDIKESEYSLTNRELHKCTLQQIQKKMKAYRLWSLLLGLEIDMKKGKQKMMLR